MKSGWRKLSVDMKYQRKGKENGRKHTASISVHTEVHCSITEGADM
jgi:hypothetical protein